MLLPVHFINMLLKLVLNSPETSFRDLAVMQSQCKLLKLEFILGHLRNGRNYVVSCCGMAERKKSERFVESASFYQLASFVCSYATIVYYQLLKFFERRNHHLIVSFSALDEFENLGQEKDRCAYSGQIQLS